jgi:hypothetical protein
MMIEYLYGELSRDQVDAFKAHLEECPACADEVAQLAEIRKLASEAPDPEPPALAIQRIVATAREEAEAPRSFWSFRWFKVLATVCVMAIVGGVVTYQVKNGIVKPAKVATSPEEKTPAAPPATEMIATGPKPVPGAVTAKPSVSAPRPTEVVNGSTEPDEPVVAEAEPPSGTMTRKAEMEEKLYVIDRASGEPIPVDSEERQHERKSSADNYLTGSTVDNQTERLPESSEPKAMAKRSMDSEGGRRGVTPPPNGGSAKLAEQLKEAQTALDAGQFGRTIQILTHVLPSLPVGHPDRPRALMWLAKAYEGQGMKSEAVEVWDSLAGESPDHSEMARRRIEALTRQ